MTCTSMAQQRKSLCLCYSFSDDSCKAGLPKTMLGILASSYHSDCKE